jgi:hypothetical protein
VLNDDKKLALYKNIFNRMFFAFYLYWKPADVSKVDYPIEKSNLEAYFGKNKVTSCMNRVDIKAISCEKTYLNNLITECDLSLFENWTNADNLIGCLINDINP